MVNYKVNGYQRINFVWILSFTRSFGTQGGNVNYRRHPCKVLHQHTCRFKRDVFIRGLRAPAKYGFNVFFCDRKIIEVPKGIFQENANGKRKFVNGIALFLQCLQAPVMEFTFGCF